jgi:hypothetical protein
MKIKAAVAFEAAKPLVIEELELGGPKAGEGAGAARRDGCLPHRRVHALGA